MLNMTAKPGEWLGLGDDLIVRVFTHDRDGKRLRGGRVKFCIASRRDLHARRLTDEEAEPVLYHQPEAPRC